MPDAENDRPAVDGPPRDTATYPTQSGSKRRRQRVAAGAVGMAVLLGAGAYLVTAQVTDAGNDAAPRTDAVRGDVAPTSPSPSATTTSTPPPGQSSKGATPVPPPAATPADRVTTTPKPKTASQRVAAARAAAAKAGVSLQRPLKPAQPLAGAVTVTNSGNLQRDGKTLRIVSAREDLTGQRELAWVADRGRPVGKSRCSQTFRLSNNAEPKRKPNLLVCWRTSAQKSVIVVAVDLDGDPAERSSAAAVDRQWKAMG